MKEIRDLVGYGFELSSAQHLIAIESEKFADTDPWHPSKLLSQSFKLLIGYRGREVPGSGADIKVRSCDPAQPI